NEAVRLKLVRAPQGVVVEVNFVGLPRHMARQNTAFGIAAILKALREVAGRDDFRFDDAADVYVCPAGKVLTTTGALVNDGATLLYRGSTFDCGPCEHKDRCCPNTLLARFREACTSAHEMWPGL